MKPEARGADALRFARTWICWRTDPAGTTATSYRASFFGSLARGTFRPASDMDLLIVLHRSSLSVGRCITDFLRAVLDHVDVQTAVPVSGGAASPGGSKPRS